MNTPDDLPILEVPCDQCDGTGLEYWADNTPGERCRKCDGAGTIATPFGERVWSFVARRIRADRRKRVYGQDDKDYGQPDVYPQS